METAIYILAALVTIAVGAVPFLKWVVPKVKRPFDAWRKEREDLRRTISDLDKQVATIVQALHERTTALETEVTSLGGQLNGLQTQVDELNDTVVQHKVSAEVNYAELMGHVSRLDASMTTVYNRLDEHEIDIERIAAAARSGTLANIYAYLKHGIPNPSNKQEN